MVSFPLGPWAPLTLRGPGRLRLCWAALFLLYGGSVHLAFKPRYVFLAFTFYISYLSPLGAEGVRVMPYCPEDSRSRLIWEAKQGQTWLALGWEITWEYQVYSVALAR